ncbi:MAG: TraR/DksA C4-type zinc finger protein, partial [Miltoncostaeaceae bacterium]
LATASASMVRTRNFFSAMPRLSHAGSRRPRLEVNATESAEARERDLQAHLRLREEEERLLRLAEAAQRGEYGICIDCGEPIPEARLEIVPDAERCVACQQAASGGRRH